MILLSTTCFDALKSEIGLGISPDELLNPASLGWRTHGREAVLRVLALRDARVDAALPSHGVLAHGLHPGADADGVVPRLDRRRHVSDRLQPGRALPATSHYTTQGFMRKERSMGWES